jgi:tetratricopeptide (TPR) repeat protein
MSKKKRAPFEKTGKNPVPVSPAKGSAGPRLWMAVSLLVVGFVLYGKTLHTPFILDDVHKIQTNPDIRIDHLSQALNKLIYPYALNPSFVRNDPSRPVTFLTYTLNYYFGRLDPFGYRLVNLLGHLAVGFLLFLLTRRLFFFLFETEHVWVSSLIALLFVVHPVNAIVALYVFNRADILAALTSLGALLLFTGPPRKSRWKKWGALVLFVIGLGSKQTVAVLPLILFVTDFVVVHRCDGASFRERLRAHLPFWIVLALYLLARMAYFGALGDLEAQSPWPRGDYLITQIYSVVRYLQFVVFPTGLSLDHMPKQYASVLDPAILLSGGLIVALAALAWAVIRRKTAVSRLVLFSVLWWGIHLAPTSSLLPTTTALAENRLYLAEYGLLLLLAVGICSIFHIGFNTPMTARTRGLSVAVLGLPLALYGGLAYNRGLLFGDPFALWKDVLRVYPNQPRAMYCLGVLHYENKDSDTALAYYEKTVKLDPHYAEAHNNMGLIYANRWETEKSIASFKKSVAAQPREKSYCNLGRAYASLKKYPEALAALDSALSLNPSSAQAYTLRGRIWYDQNDLAQARANFQMASPFAPDSHELQNNMALVSLAEKKYGEALAHLDKAIAAQPNYAEAYYNLAVVYTQMGQSDPAREYFEKACSLDPQYIFKPVEPGIGPHGGKTFQVPPDIQKYLNSLSSPGR